MQGCRPVGALTLERAVAILATAGHVGYHHRSRRELVRPATLMVAFVVMQITLGAFVIWSGLQPIVNTAHVVNGALLLATTVVLTLRSRRVLFAQDDAVLRTAPGVSRPGGVLPGDHLGSTTRA